MLDRVPFQDHRGLGCVSAAENRRLGLRCSEGVIDGILQRDERGLGFLLGREVARDGNIYYASG
jgi:hypothetical protein